MKEYPIIDLPKTGENFRKLREERGLAIRDVQQYLGLEEPQALYQWQKGMCLPSVDHLCALSVLLGVSMNEILVLADRGEGGETNQVRRTSKYARKTRCLLFLCWGKDGLRRIISPQSNHSS